MKLKKFKKEVRRRRGKLTKHDKDLEVIHTYGIDALRMFTLEKKLMGIHNIAFIAMQDDEYQENFCSWMATKKWKADKNELDLWFGENNKVEA